MAQRGRPPIKKPERAVVSSDDARVIVNIFSPDHEPKQFSYTVKNLRGNTTHALREPKEVMQSIINGLVRKYGS